MSNGEQLSNGDGKVCFTAITWTQRVVYHCFRRFRYEKVRTSIPSEEEGGDDEEEGDDDDSVTAPLTTSVSTRDESKLLTVSEAVEHIGMGMFQIRTLAVAGFSFFSEALETMLLAILAPALKCEWLLSDVQVALITTVVFVGFMVMAPFWGSLADHYGRRHIAVIVCLWMTYYGYLTSFSPTFVWVLLLRGCVGAGVAGQAQLFVLISEYIPLKWRGRILISGGAFWTVGALLEIGIAAALMPNIPPDAPIPGWRILVFLSSVPLTIVFFALRFLPESARFLVAAGRSDEALEILNKAAAINKQPKLPGKLKAEHSETRGSVAELFKGGLARITIGNWMLWFTAGFIYYGMVLLSATLLEINKKQCAIDIDARAELEAGGSAASASSVCSCTPMSSDAYYSMLISTFGELGSTFLNLLTLDRFGRRYTMAAYLAIEGVCFLLLVPCGMNVHVMTFLIFIVRGLSGSFFNAIYIYVAEVYPTRVRALGIGSSSAAARVGCIVTPFVAQVLIEHDRTAALIVYGCLALVSSVITLLMTVETKDRHQTN